jgi:C-terminal binding protein
LALTRGIAPLNSMLQQGGRLWSPEHVYPLQRLRGQVFGIVGLGRIGTAAAIRAKALGMQVKFYDPYRDDGYDKAVGIQRVETLQELVESSYVLSLHCPLTAETHHLVTAETIERMPARSFLVNTARGAVVDTSAIPPAIVSGHLAGAGIDVLADEPPAEDDPLIVAWRDPQHPAHHRVLVNPHAAFYSQQGLEDMREKAAQAVRRALVGEPLRNVVNGVR